MKSFAGTFAFAVLAMIGAVEPGFATTMFPQKFKCPIGGERFEDYVIGSSTSWGSRPDGRSYGTLPIYPVVECPKNGFILYDEDIPESDLRILKPLVEGAEYQALRTSETPHYRVWWLLKAVAKGEPELVGALLQASWETDDDASRKSRYQEAFVAAVRALPGGDGLGNRWLVFRLRAANALRELGRFEEAATLLNEAAKPAFLPTDADERSGTEQFVGGLRRLIAEHNRFAEPTSLIPPREALQRCEGAVGALSPAESEACRGPAIEAARNEMREWEAQRTATDDASANQAAEAAEEATRSTRKAKRGN